MPDVTEFLFDPDHTLEIKEEPPACYMCQQILEINSRDKYPCRHHLIKRVTHAETCNKELKRRVDILTRRLAAVSANSRLQQARPQECGTDIV
jgi:hypothetical protein